MDKPTPTATPAPKTTTSRKHTRKRGEKEENWFRGERKEEEKNNKFLIDDVIGGSD